MTRPHSSRPSRRFAVFAVPLFVVLLAGCARPVGTVNGTVTYNGKALKGGNVIFESDEGGPSYSAAIKEDGSYTVPNIRGGEYKVCVETKSLKPSGSTVTYGNKPMPGSKKTPQQKLDPNTAIPEGYTPSNPADAAAAATAKKYVAIPEKYASKDTTDLKYTVVGGDQTYPIDLK